MAPPKSDRRARISAYKQILRDVLDRRPSGARLRIARLLGTHKSFVSQITNPADPTPVPARHLGKILDICQMAEPERARFLAAYHAAHPQQAPEGGAATSDPGPDLPRKTLHVDVPVLADPAAQQALEALIRDFAHRTARLLADAGRGEE
jgi:hypothetical protein